MTQRKTQRKTTAALAAMVLTLTGVAIAADSDAINLLKTTGALDRLAKESGVYNASSTGKTPGFVIDREETIQLRHGHRLTAGRIEERDVFPFHLAFEHESVFEDDDVGAG